MISNAVLVSDPQKLFTYRTSWKLSEKGCAIDAMRSTSEPRPYQYQTEETHVLLRLIVDEDKGGLRRS